MPAPTPRFFHPETAMSLVALVGTALDRARSAALAGRLGLLELFESVELATSKANAIAPHDPLQARRYVQLNRPGNSGDSFT